MTGRERGERERSSVSQQSHCKAIRVVEAHHGKGTYTERQRQ